MLSKVRLERKTLFSLVCCLLTVEWIAFLYLEMNSWQAINLLPFVLVFSIAILVCCFEWAFSENDNMLSLQSAKRPVVSKKPRRSEHHDRCGKCGVFTDQLSIHGLCPGCQKRKEKYGNSRRNARTTEDTAIS